MALHRRRLGKSYRPRPRPGAARPQPPETITMMTELSPQQERQLLRFEPRGKPPLRARTFPAEKLQRMVAEIDANELARARGMPEIAPILERKFKLNIQATQGILLGSDLASIKFAEEYILAILRSLEGQGDDDELKGNWHMAYTSYLANCLIGNYGCRWTVFEDDDALLYPNGEMIEPFLLVQEFMMTKSFKLWEQYREITFRLELMGY